MIEPPYSFAAADETGAVKRLVCTAEQAAPFNAVPLESPARSWPSPPGPAHVLHVNGGGQLYWVDPRSTEQRSADARTERDTLLAATDWRVTRALEQGSAVPSAWAGYRQQLRDLPQQPGFPDSITWPTPPTA